MLCNTPLKASIQASDSVRKTTFHAPPLGTLICLADLHRYVLLHRSGLKVQKWGQRGQPGVTKFILEQKLSLYKYLPYSGAAALYEKAVCQSLCQLMSEPFSSFNQTGVPYNLLGCAYFVSGSCGRTVPEAKV